MKDGKDFIKSMALLTGSFLFIFFLLEISVRLVYGNHPVFLYPQAHHVNRDYGFSLKPNQKMTYTLDKPVVSNSFGFRDYDWEVPKPKDRVRIMCLGDSLTFGNGVRGEETYPKVLEKKLKNRNPNIQVISTSIGGWETYNETDFLKMEGLKYQPDIVIIGFYPNDFATRPNKKRVFIEGGTSDDRPPWLRWLPYKYIYLLKRSALIHYLRIRIGNFSRGKKAFTTLLLENEIDLDHDKRVKDTYSYLVEAKKICDENNIKMILASIPPINFFWMEKDSVRYNKHLKRFCETKGIPFIDLSERFWDEKEIKKLYMYPWDNHLSPKGHELVAEQLLPVISQSINL